MTKGIRERLRLELTGIVQGVGFRPYIYRLAERYNLCGWVANHTAGVCVEVEGSKPRLRRFVQSLSRELPPHAEIHSLTTEQIALQGDTGFNIRQSDTRAAPAAALILPDLAPCDTCLRELFDRENRRFRYPFLNCTHCGPRFSIVERLPYDRANTAMQRFPLCKDCRAEYTDPANRRFHAEPNACAQCGPQLTYCAADGTPLAGGDDALWQAVHAIRAGNIVAIKNVGGFQLIADAARSAVVALLRQRKQRPHKPFALLYPDIKTIHRDCYVSVQEEEQLLAPERPILLLNARSAASDKLCAQVAPDNPNLGVMLPSSPLHHLLMRDLSRPLIATSGNLAGEPICIDNQDALQRLAPVADGFLVHNRGILRPLDDSIVRVMDGQPVILRRARGYAPRPLGLPDRPSQAGPILAAGADLKNTVAVARGNTVFASPHIGDLESRIAMAHFARTVGDLTRLYADKRADLGEPRVTCDLHPGFLSTRWCQGRDSHLLQVQHHVAHFFSCLAEHAAPGPALGICWDGTGFGEDGALRGSEFLYWGGRDKVRRVACLRDFPLPGGEQAIRDPRRTLAGLLFEHLGPNTLSSAGRYGALLREKFSAQDLANLERILARKLNTPICSSVGRLFDAVSVLLGLAATTTFEGQAAMALEFAAQGSEHSTSYPFELNQEGAVWKLDWGPMLEALMKDQATGATIPYMAIAVHNTLAQMALSVAIRFAEKKVFLSGGAFQNKRLLETTTQLLRKAGFRVHSHSKVPPNDGGIAVGQIYYARCIGTNTGPSMENGKAEREAQ
ncbi:carbamoyltransferase HypF [Microbulbifer mangrovi]|uniref:carbamoyltransferase HypF n=1 Tax=Microbulbifer mangrovi TaxID=927787 RepID=UPI0009903A7C|nr:carbamoyltransferase HypF [Microbulbifer mangrovi]